MASEEPFSITIPPIYIHWQYVHWALLAVKYFSVIRDKDSDQGPTSRLLKKNPKPAKERNLSDDLLRRYYPRFELKGDCRYYEPFNNVPYPKFAEDEFFASEKFDKAQNEEIEMTKSVLEKSSTQATSDMDKVSLQQIGRMWEFVSQFKAKVCYFIDGPGQVTHHLLIVHGKGSSKEDIDSSTATLQELYKSLTKSSEEVRGEVVAMRAKVEESRNSWQQLLNSDTSELHKKLTDAFPKYLETERKTWHDLTDSRNVWKKASDQGTWWERYSQSGSSAIGLGFPDDVPSCESHFFAFEDSVLQKDVTKCDLYESKFQNPPSPALVKLLKERRGAHDEARTELASAREATIKVARIHGMAQQIVSSLGLIKDQCDKLRDGIHAIGNSVRAMDRTIPNLPASQNYIADIRQLWTVLSEIERSFLGQHLTWEDYIARVGLRRITLMPPVSDADGEYFRLPSFLEAHTEHNVLDIPWICASPEDLQRQRDWGNFTKQTGQDLNMKLEQLKQQQRRDIYQLQEREEQRARDELSFMDKILRNKAYVRPPRPTIHCCPY